MVTENGDVQPRGSILTISSPVLVTITSSPSIVTITR
jgi:hypothetical protein